jgi:hypothetical protein
MRSGEVRPAVLLTGQRWWLAQSSNTSIKLCYATLPKRHGKLFSEVHPVGSSCWDGEPARMSVDWVDCTTARLMLNTRPIHNDFFYT